MKPRTLRLLLPLLALLCLTAIGGCGHDRKDYVGTYGAASDHGPVTLVLREDGTGTWTTESGAITFRWSTRNGDLTLHTRTGGAIPGRATPDGLHLNLPAMGELDFSRRP